MCIRDRCGVSAAEPDCKYRRHVRVQHDDGGRAVVGFVSAVSERDDNGGWNDGVRAEAVVEVTSVAVRLPSRAGSLPPLISGIHTLCVHRRSNVGASLLAMAI